MRYEHIVWDFNGTLIDDVSLGVAATNILLARRGIPEIDLEVYYREFGFPVKDYYTRIGFDFSTERYEDVADEWIVEYRRLEHTVSLRDGVLDLLCAFRAEGIVQTVLSASEQTMLEEQLAALGIRSFFENVVGRSDVHATDKTELARSFAREYKLGRTLMIGDTDHDAACAKAAGFDCALVAGGHHPRARLEKVEGARLFDSLRDLHATLCVERSIPLPQTVFVETDGRAFGDIITPVELTLTENGHIAAVHPHFRRSVAEFMESGVDYPAPPDFFERLTERLSTEIFPLGYQKEEYATAWGYLLRLQDATKITLKTEISSPLNKDMVDNYKNSLICGLRGLLSAGHLGFAVIENGEIVSAAVTHDPVTEEEQLAEITVETVPAARRKGYASACVAALARELLSRGILVLYSCHSTNRASLAVAKKVGFEQYAQFYRFVGRRD